MHQQAATNCWCDMAQQRALAWLAVEHDPRSHADVAAARVAVTLSWVQKHMVAGYQQLRGVKNTKGHVSPTTDWQQGIRWKSITLSTRPAAATGASPDAGRLVDGCSLWPTSSDLYLEEVG